MVADARALIGGAGHPVRRGGAGAAAFQWLSDSRTSESTTTAQKVPSDETLTVRFLDVGQGDSILLSCGEDTMLIDGGRSRRGSFWCPV